MIPRISNMTHSQVGILGSSMSSFVRSLYHEVGIIPLNLINVIHLSIMQLELRMAHTFLVLADIVASEY